MVFTPWAFGTTQSWSIWTANIASYALGLVLVAKWILRWRLEHHPARWGEMIVVRDDSGQVTPQNRPWDPGTAGLAALTVFLLGYVLVSALNARAYFDPALKQLEYLGEPIRWLPHTYDRSATWAAFAQYLALACVFWAARDWLLHRSDDDDREDDAPKWAERQPRITLPARLRRLLWVLCLNAAALALVSILQRADGTNKLLWILGSRSNKAADQIFGPWSYRANAAQYFNLAWPVCLAFWLWLQERAGRAALHRGGRYDGPQLVLLPCALFVASAPVVSSSRGGALVCAGIGVASALVILSVSRRHIAASARWLTVGTLAGAALLALLGGWSSLKERLARPDARFATNLDAGTNDFTLLVRTKVPPQPDTHWRRLITLAPGGRASSAPHMFTLLFSPQGAILAQRFGSTLTNYSYETTSNNTVLASVGLDKVVAVTRQDGVQIYFDGQPVPGSEGKNGIPPGWKNYLPTRYTFVHDPAVSEMALVNFALTAGEIAQASQASSLASLAESLANATSFSDPNLGAGSTDLTVPDGATAEAAKRPTDPSTPWLAVRRATSEGPLGLQRKLPTTLDARLRGPLRLALQVWNPNDFPIYLSARIDGGHIAEEEIAPRSEQRVELACRAPHGGAPSQINLAFSDAEGDPDAALPSGTALYLRDLHVFPGAAIVTRKLNPEIRLFDLADRMSGRNEVYENANQMLADYSFWGIGAGSFASLYQLYMKPGQDWAAYLHNDWLETRITFGLIGYIALLAGLAALALRSSFGNGLPSPRVVIALFWIALVGCLLHARFDYPFQIYSVVFLFVLLSAVLLVLTARHRH